MHYTFECSIFINHFLTSYEALTYVLKRKTTQSFKVFFETPCASQIGGGTERVPKMILSELKHYVAGNVPAKEALVHPLMRVCWNQVALIDNSHSLQSFAFLTSAWARNLLLADNSVN